MGKRKRDGKKFGLRVDMKWDAPKLSADEHRARTCGDKELRTERDARTQAQLKRGRGEPMHAYECPYCGYWHIGH